MPSVSDFVIRVPETAVPGACMEKVKCLKISAAPEAKSAKEQTWCLDPITQQWHVYSESEPPPPTQTITLQGTEDICAAQGILDELYGMGCPGPFQAVIFCENEFDEVITWPGVSLNARTPDNGYGYGVPGVDTGAAPPMTVSRDGTYFGKVFRASQLLRRRAIVSSIVNSLPTGSVISKVFFCDIPTCGATVCGAATPSNGCRTFYAIVDDDDDNAILAQFAVDRAGTVTFVGSEIYSTVNGKLDGACINGQLVLTDGTCVFTKCGTLGFTKVVLPSEVPDGSIMGISTTFGNCDHIYVLFGTSGVLHSSNARNFTVALQDGFLPVGQQSSIDSAGDVVVTGGLNSSLQFSNTGGQSWSDHVIDSNAPTDDVMDVAVDLVSPISIRHALIYPLTTNGTKMTVYISSDNALTFEGRSTFDEYPTIPETANIEAAVNGVNVYVMWDSTFKFNVAHACECDWMDLSPDLTCVSAKTDVCMFDPATVLFLGDGICTIFARNDVAEVVSDTPGVPVIIDVLANDRPAPGETLDPATVDLVPALPALPADAQAVTINPATGEITVTPDDGFTGIITFTYTVDDTAPNTATAEVKLVVGDVSAALLVC